MSLNEFKKEVKKGFFDYNSKPKLETSKQFNYPQHLKIKSNTIEIYEDHTYPTNVPLQTQDQSAHGQAHNDQGQKSVHSTSKYSGKKAHGDLAHSWVGNNTYDHDRQQAGYSKTNKDLFDTFEQLDHSTKTPDMHKNSRQHTKENVLLNKASPSPNLRGAKTPNVRPKKAYDSEDSPRFTPLLSKKSLMMAENLPRPMER